MKIAVTIEGTSPGLLMHRFSVETETELVKETKKKKATYLKPAEEARQAAYLLDDGSLYQPAEHLY